MHFFVFAEKLRRPDPAGLSRPRLERRLTGPDARPVALVLGPAGSGKTTLLSRVAAQTPLPSAWYRAAAEDADEAALVAHLAQALGSVLGDSEVAASGAEGTVAGLVSALERGAAIPAHLVIDDLHEILGSEAELALEQFCRWRPHRIQLLLGSRRPPGLNTSRLLVSGELDQLDAEDLRFRSWEVEELFRTVYDQPLAPEAAAALTRRTGGWAAGLQLFHLATSGVSRLERERAVGELSGRSRLIRSYLARNVLEGLPAQRRDFLLRTCTLGVLTAGLCDTLLARSDSTSTLADLEQQQFFTSSTDQGATYRYHQVLQTHLEVLLVDEYGAAAARRLYARSAELLESEGLLAAALPAHARAEDWGAVARLLQHTSSGLPADDRFWLTQIPGLPHDDPGLVVANARRMLRAGRLSEAVDSFLHAESLLDDPDFQARCRGERDAAAPWLTGGTPPDPPRDTPVGRGLRLSRELRLVTRDVTDPRRATSTLARGVGLLFAGDISAAAVELRRADPEAGGWERLAIGLAAQIAESDESPDPSAAFEQILLAAEVDGLPWLARLARGWQAAVLLRTDTSAGRIASARELVDTCDREGDHWGACLLALAFGGTLVLRDRSVPSPSPSEDPSSGAEPIGSTGPGEALRAAAELLRLALARSDDLGAPVLGAWAYQLLEQALSESARSGEAAIRTGPDQRARHAEAARLGVSVPGRTPTSTSADASSSMSPPRSPGMSPAISPATAGPRFGGGNTPGRGVRLGCLGRFELTIDGRILPWRGLRPRARALLMLLALHHGRGRHRETLIADLWPDATLSSGLRSLQVAVSSIRQCLARAGLAEDCVRRQGDAYALCLPEAQIELAEFELLIREGSRAEASGDASAAVWHRLSALELYEGDLLPELGPAEWVVPERERLRTLAATAGADAARAAGVLGELPTGIRAARRSLELDPYSDQSWRLLVELCERSGDHSAATVARRDHERICAALGI